MGNSEKEAKMIALERAVAEINKKYGSNAIMRMDDENYQSFVTSDTISSGSLSLDIALGIGGLPRGRVIEVFGPEASGKTTLALHAIASVQKKDGLACFIDAEHALDPTYAKNIGVKLNELRISQPDSGEQALEICETMVRSGAVDIVVVDSVAALTPQAEIDGDMGDSHVGLQARLMSQALRKLTAVISKSNCTVIFINQLREKVGIMFGNPETTTGGRALKFYASCRIEMRYKEAITRNGEKVGQQTKIKVVKNKMAPPFKEVFVDIEYGKGFSKEGDIIELGVQHGIINKSGAWYSYDGNKLGQGKESVKEALKNNLELSAEIEDKIRELFGLQTVCAETIKNIG